MLIICRNKTNAYYLYTNHSLTLLVQSTSLCSLFWGCFAACWGFGEDQIYVLCVILSFVFHIPTCIICWGFAACFYCAEHIIDFLSFGKSTFASVCVCVCKRVGVFSSCPHDIEFEVKVKGCYLVCKCFQATYVCVFVPLVPTAADQNRGHSWPESRPGGQLFPRSDTVFLWLLTIPSACWLPTSGLWFFWKSIHPNNSMSSLL